MPFLLSLALRQGQPIPVFFRFYSPFTLMNAPHASPPVMETHPPATASVGPPSSTQEYLSAIYRWSGQFAADQKEWRGNMDKRLDRSAADQKERFDQFAADQKEWRDHMDKRLDQSAADQKERFDQFAADQKEWRDHMDKRLDQSAADQKEWRDNLDKRQDRLVTDLDKRFDQSAAFQKEWRESLDKRQDRQDGVIVKLAADLDKRLAYMDKQIEGAKKEFRIVVGIGAGFITLIVTLLKFIG